MRTTGVSSRAAKSAALLILLGVPAAGYVAWRETAAKETAAHFERLDLVTAGGVRTLDVEVARTPDEQALGLMYRTSLDDTHGMLFPYAQARELTMWMRNTYIPLDMVFIKADGTVHRIEARTEPLSDRVIASHGDVAAVLEIAGGAAERLGLKPGDKVRYRHFAEPKP
jgi:hypothetical protein